MAQDLAMQSPNNILDLTLKEELSFQSIDETPELRDIPPIRDNPEMAQTTAKRRSSVANPNSIQYRDPAISTDSSPNDQSSTDEEHDAIDDVFSATNENIHHDGDPSLSDLNEINERQHYQPINQRDDTEQHSQSQIQAQAEEDEDPFARLGQKQQSVALPPLISRIHHQQQRLQQIQRAKQQQIQQMHAMPPPQNPYTPENVLHPKHLQQRHTRAGSKHSRSQTLVTASGYHNNQIMQPQLKQRHNKRHQHKSSSVDWSGDQMSGPPLGPDLTFVCMRIENRTILQDGLSDSNFLQLMQIHNAIMLDRLKHFHGHCIESNNGHIYDVLTVFNDVYDAMRYAINVQKELNAYTWPSFFYQLESQSSRMQYVGKGNRGAFNGLRVGMGLHTATVDSHGDINRYDGGKETLTVKTVIFDAHYQGSAVELAKNLCLVAYGGELLASKAVSQALLRSKKGGDEVSIQRLGTCKIANIRKVELIQLIPRDLPHRMFPPRSFKSFKALNTVQPHQPQVSVLGNILNDASETPSYDPFPVKKEYHSDDEDDDEESHSDNSHSSKDEIQHNPRISNPRRRPSITQIGHVGPDTQIEVSFNGGDDDLDDDKQDYDHNLLGVNVYGQDVVNNMDSDHSIGPPKQHKSRNKAQEIEKRKSVIQGMGIDDAFLPKEQSKKKRNKKQKTKAKAKRQASGRDGDDEHSPLPGDSDFGQDNIGKPRRGPRANKKQEHYKTLIGIDFDPDADSSVYSAGSRSIRTSTTVKSYNKLLNPQHQLKLYKVQPPNLPSAYSDDKEFTCLSCQEIHKWTDGVWRVPLWPSFDVCVVCGNKALQTGTSKKDYTNFDPTGAHNTLIYSPHDAHNSFGDLNGGKHRKVPSTAPIMKEYIETVNGNNEYKITQEALEMLRKQLSSIIEELTNQKMFRLDNLSKWANNDAEFDEFRTKTIAEHKATEDDINHWRRKAKRLDEQDQRVLRRRNTVNLDGMSPNASDLESDEELHQNWQDYDYKHDFAHINDRIKDLDALFWTEDQFYRKKFENTHIANRDKFKLLQQQYSQTTHELQQRNDELTTKITALIQQNDNINTYQLGSEETDSDDLDNDNMAKYSKYVPPSIKHIHENSEVKDEDITDANALEDKVKEQNSMIDHYISTVNRKDRELRQSQQAIEELKSKILYLENLTEQEEEFAAIHDELQRTRQEKRALETKLKMYLYDEPAQQPEQSETVDSNSNSIFDDFSIEQKERDDQVLIDAQLFKDNQIRLKAANVTIDKLQDEIDGIVDENSRLAKGKMQLLNKTSQQMEVMRDELQNMCKQLQIKDYTIKKLIHINKEGYDPDIDQKDDTRKTSISYLGINNPITGLLTFGRSKFSSSVHTLADSKKSKIDLAISTAAEIQRLREIITVLSTQTTYGNTKQNGASQSYGLLNGVYPGSY